MDNSELFFTVPAALSLSPPSSPWTPVAAPGLEQQPFDPENLIDVSEPAHESHWPSYSDADYQLSHWCRTVYLVVGRDEEQIAFPIQGRYLLRVPEISRFSISGGNYYLKEYSQNVVKCVLFSLMSKAEEREDKLPRTHFWRENSSPSFFVSLYYLATTLEMEWLADQAMTALEELCKHGHSLKLLFEAADLTKLIDDKRFVTWLGPRVIHHEAFLVGTWASSLEAASSLRALILVLAFTKHLRHKMNRLKGIMDEI
ncbi:hypothetical protein S40288_11010 [Stachybotrys chartarum IBT 40288]|nr:hypothetical protein S40288_11010 [Stachybotrys chartarum IBT 40288]